MWRKLASISLIFWGIIIILNKTIFSFILGIILVFIGVRLFRNKSSKINSDTYDVFVEEEEEDIPAYIPVDQIVIDRPYKGNKVTFNYPSDYTVIDIETTGLSSSNSHILEVAALRVRDNDIVDSFSTFIAPSSKIATPPEKYIPKKITKLTGITYNMLDGAPQPSEAFKMFLAFIENDILIAHNANFDINFLYDKILQELNIYLKNDFVDTLTLSRNAFPSLPSHSRENLISSLSLEFRKGHRALDDCYTCKEIYDKSIDKLGPNAQSKEKPYIYNSSGNRNGSTIHPSEAIEDAKIRESECAFSELEQSYITVLRKIYTNHNAKLDEIAFHNNGSAGYLDASRMYNIARIKLGKRKQYFLIDDKDHNFNIGRLDLDTETGTSSEGKRTRVFLSSPSDLYKLESIIIEQYHIGQQAIDNFLQYVYHE